MLAEHRIEITVIATAGIIALAGILTPKALPLIPFIIIFPLLYHFRKFAGFLLAYSWYGFLCIIYYLSTEIPELGTFTIVSGALIMASFFLWLPVIFNLKSHVQERYPAEALRAEREKAFLINAVLALGTMATGAMTVKTNSAAAKMLGPAMLILAMLLTMPFNITLRSLKSPGYYLSTNAVDLALSTFGWGALMLPIAYMSTTYYPSGTATVPVVQEIYCTFLIALGGGMLMLHFQVELGRMR